MWSLSSVVALTGSLALAATTHLASSRALPEPPQGGPVSNAPQGQEIAGISCEAMEGSKTHIHQHLVLLDHGKSVVIPPNVGQPATRRCLYWVHTHTSDGIIHIESPQMRTFTLGEFFLIWGKPLTKMQA